MDSRSLGCVLHFLVALVSGPAPGTNWSGWIPYLSISGQSAQNGMVGYGSV